MKDIIIFEEATFYPPSKKLQDKEQENLENTFELLLNHQRLRNNHYNLLYRNIHDTNNSKP